jgi:O-antigen/teichoic acid export membrane protein
MRIFDRLNYSSHAALIKGALWTLGAFGALNLLRVASSVVVARLLAPDLFGIMMIVYAFRHGIELLSDFGIGQNIVYSKSGEEPEFYNTAWSLQLLRGLILWAICAVIAVPVARFYHSPILVWVLPAASLVSVLTGATSISLFLLRKRLQTAKLNSFEMVVSVISTAAQIAIAYVTRTIWALVLGGIIGSALTAIGSYFLLPNLKQRFAISKKHAQEILSFGRWIFLSSLVYFLSSSFDSLYLGRSLPLVLLGVYGIARNISVLLSDLIVRLGNIVVFPFISSQSHISRGQLREQLTSIRLGFLLITALGLSFFAAIADLLIRILYDQRYHDAAWMLPILILGSWFSILSSLNEATLLGFGKPNYTTAGNVLKFGFLLVGLLFSVPKYGVLGGVVIVATADLFRYFPVYIGQFRERFSFGMQDLLTSLAIFGLFGFWQYVRCSAGWGTSFDKFPI